MKAARIVLIISIATNVAWIFAIAGQWHPREESAARVITPSIPHATDAEPPDPTTSSPVFFAPSWESLEPGDLRILADRLGDSGLSRRMVVAIVMDLAEERAHADLEHERIALARLPFWQKGTARMPPPHLIARLAAAQRAKRQLLTEAFGPDYLSEDESALREAAATFGVSDSGKLQQLARLQADRLELSMESDLPGEAYGVIPGFHAHDLINREFEADLAAILSPTELSEYRLRTSPVADFLRSNLPGFAATESEYRALFHMLDAANHDGSRPPRVETLMACLPAISEILPAARVADLKQALAPGTERVNKLVARFGLPLSAATPVSDVQRDIRSRARLVETDVSLSAGQRTEQLAALAREAAARILNALGPEVFAAYLDYEGDWLVALDSSSKPHEP